MKGNISYGRRRSIVDKFRALRNSTSNIGMSCQLIDVYRHIRLFPFIEVSRNASEYSPLSRPVLLKNFELKYWLIELCHETDWPHFIRCFLKFPRTPVSQTSASNWLTRFIWKEIFSYSRRRSIVDKFRAVFEKLDYKHRHVMSADRRISPYAAVSFNRSF